MNNEIGCGESETTGHGQSRTCGKIDYNEYYFCAKCLRKQIILMFDRISTLEGMLREIYREWIEDDSKPISFSMFKQIQKELGEE